MHGEYNIQYTIHNPKMIDIMGMFESKTES